MTPHSYSLDSQSKSTDLAAKFSAANTPPQIAAAVAAVESHLSVHSPDQNRHFFSLAFPSLLCKFFGFDVSSSSPQKSPPSAAGWIDTVSFSNDSDLAGKLFNLLSPNGTLMNSIMAVDRLSLVKFVFPVERLPEWVRFLLSSERDCRILSDLCPLFKGRIKEDEIKGIFQVHLNVFEYLMFWFAYYPVCRGKCENSGIVSVSSSRKSKLENWAASIPVISSGSKRTSESKTDCNLYSKLLYAYLRAFVPMNDLNAHQPYRSSLLHYSSSYDDSVVLRAEFFVETLVHYWLVDSDFSPLAVNVCKSFGLSFPFRSVLGETPPASGLGEMVKLLVKYLNLSLVMVTDGSKQVEYCGSPITPMYKKLSSSDFVKTREVPYVLSSLPSGGSWNSYIQRPLYRFILRTFLYCPMGVSVKNISEVFSVWINYIEPWKLSKEEFAEFDLDDASKTRPDKADVSNQQQFSIVWQGYVLSNYLFYTSLVMHFIGFAHKFLHVDAEVIVQMISRVIDILISSRELLELIKNVDAIFNLKNAGSGKSAVNHLNTFIPQIREQLQDWEDGLSETDADGSFLHENWNKELRLFDDSEDGGSQLLQLFILRAETELQAISGDNLANNLQCLHSLKSNLRCLFGDHAVKQSPVSPRTEQLHHSRDELFKPRRLSKGSVTNDNYKGDWLRRPISDDEVAWLAKLLIHLSIWLNNNLGLYGGVDGSCPYVEVPNDVVNVCGLSDFLKVVMCSIVSWFLAVRLAILKLMIKHRLRVNLRIFASKKFVSVVFVFALFSMLKRVFRSIW